MDERWACPRCDAHTLEQRAPTALHCKRCGLVFGTARVHALPQTGDAPIVQVAEPPIGLVVEDSTVETSAYRDHVTRRDGLRITKVWRDPWVIFPALFPASVLALIAYSVLHDGSWYGAPLMVLGLLAAMSLYVIIAVWKNRTVIELSGGALTVRHGPVPWPGNVRVDAARIRQIWCVSTSLRYQSSYHLFFVEEGGKPKRLLRGLADVRHALYIEWALERALHIQDEPVPGELEKQYLRDAWPGSP